MAVHVITFRIHNDNTYDERYQSVVDAIVKLSPAYWAETTSFFVIENSGTSADVAKYIDDNSKFASSKDLLVVINLSQKGYTPIGKLTDNDLHELMKRR